MYLIKKLNTINFKKHIIIISLFALLIGISEVHYLKTFKNYDNNTELLLFYIECLNDLWLYFLPISGLYLYLSDDILKFNIERKYAYKFKVKNDISKNSIIITFIYTIIFILITNLFLVITLYFFSNKSINGNFIIYLNVSIILQTAVFIIYNLICLCINSIFNNDLILTFAKSGIFLMILLGFNSQFEEIIMNISLYNFFTINNIITKNKTVLYSILLLCLIIYILINIKNKLSDRDVYLD